MSLLQKPDGIGGRNNIRRYISPVHLTVVILGGRIEQARGSMDGKCSSVGNLVLSWRY